MTMSPMGRLRISVGDHVILQKNNVININHSAVLFEVLLIIPCWVACFSGTRHLTTLESKWATFSTAVKHNIENIFELIILCII